MLFTFGKGLHLVRVMCNKIALAVTLYRVSMDEDAGSRKINGHMGQGFFKIIKSEDALHAGKKADHQNQFEKTAAYRQGREARYHRQNHEIQVR
jgi:hypothetical protein